MNIILTEQQILNNVFLTEDRISRLILEGKDPVELLKYKFRDIPESVIEKIVSIDPTKKKSYSQWLCKQWNNEKDYIVKNLDNGNIGKLFQFTKEHPDIQIKDIPSVAEGIKMYVGEEQETDSVLGKSNEPTTYVKNLHADVDSNLANDFDILFKQDEWIIASPNTYEASCKLGEGMKWCTANAFGNGEQYYNNYLSQGGKYYVNFDLSKGEQGNNGIDYPYTRYQFHFESNQFMDKDDEPVILNEIGMPESAAEFYDNEGYDINEYGLSDEERVERYDEQRRGDGIYLVDGLELLQEYDEYWEFEESNYNTDYYIFDTDNDDRDPLVYDMWFRKEDDLIQYKNDDDSIFILKRADDKHAYALVCQEGSNEEWSVHGILSYEVNGNAVLGLNGESCELYYCNGYDDEMMRLSESREYVKAFFNPNIKSNEDYDIIYAELVTEDGFHTLVEISPDSKVIISLDVPINGEMFVTDENLKIQGKYKSYNLGEFNGDDEASFQIIDKLDDETVVVQFEKGDEEGLQNILNLKSGKYLCKFNFTKLGFDNEYGYIVKDVEGYNHILDINGNEIGGKYERVSVIKQPCVFAGFYYGQEKVDLINLENYLVSSVKKINTKFGIINNSIISVDALKGEKGVLFDFQNKKRILNGYNSFEKLNMSHFIFGKKQGEQSYTMFDTNSFEPKIGNILEINTLKRMTDYEPIKITFADGKSNLFNVKEENFLLPQNADSIDTRQSDNGAYSVCIFPYSIGDRLFFFTTKTNQNGVNPNGLNKNEYENRYRLDSYSRLSIKTLDDKYTINFDTNGEPLSYVDNTKGYSGTYLIEKSNDMEMLRWLTSITGKDYTKGIKENVLRDFNNTLIKLLTAY